MARRNRELRQINFSSPRIARTTFWASASVVMEVLNPVSVVLRGYSESCVSELYEELDESHGEGHEQRKRQSDGWGGGSFGFNPWGAGSDQ